MVSQLLWQVLVWDTWTSHICRVPLWSMLPSPTYSPISAPFPVVLYSLFGLVIPTVQENVKTLTSDYPPTPHTQRKAWKDLASNQLHRNCFNGACKACASDHIPPMHAKQNPSTIQQLVSLDFIYHTSTTSSPDHTNPFPPSARAMLLDEFPPMITSSSRPQISKSACVRMLRNSSSWYSILGSNSAAVSAIFAFPASWKSD